MTLASAVRSLVSDGRLEMVGDAICMGLRKGLYGASAGENENGIVDALREMADG
jgi:hypothetical protein